MDYDRAFFGYRLEFIFSPLICNFLVCMCVFVWLIPFHRWLGTFQRLMNRAVRDREQYNVGQWNASQHKQNAYYEFLIKIKSDWGERQSVPNHLLRWNVATVREETVRFENKIWSQPIHKFWLAIQFAYSQKCPNEIPSQNINRFQFVRVCAWIQRRE